jgi:crossover junction endodeoxyribonuclease RuvC
VKQSVTGNGNASKEQVAKMLMSLFKLKELPELFDATDALAVAMCHHYNAGMKKSKSKSWGDFVKENTDRVK